MASGVTLRAVSQDSVATMSAAGGVRPVLCPQVPPRTGFIAYSF